MQASRPPSMSSTVSIPRAASGSQSVSAGEMKSCPSSSTWKRDMGKRAGRAGGDQRSHSCDEVSSLPIEFSELDADAGSDEELPPNSEPVVCATLLAVSRT